MAMISVIDTSIYAMADDLHLRQGHADLKVQGRRYYYNRYLEFSRQINILFLFFPSVTRRQLSSIIRSCK